MRFDATHEIKLCVRLNRLSHCLCTCVFSSSAKTKVQTLGTTLYGYAETYYEDNIQPLTDSYTQWASGVKNSVLEKIQHTVGNYIPITANETDSAGQQ